MGAPTVIAEVASPNPNSQLAARLLDIAPNGDATLIARALYRPPAGGASRQVFQLHPNGWHFAPGHVAKLELLPDEGAGGSLTSYGRASNTQGPITVSNLQLRLPVLQKPGALGGMVGAPEPKVLPPGTALATDFAQLPRLGPTIFRAKLRASRKRVKVRVRVPAGWEALHATVRLFRPASGFPQKKIKRRQIGVGKGVIPGGTTRPVVVKLSKKTRRLLAKRGKQKRRRFGVGVSVTTSELDTAVTAVRSLVGPKVKSKKKKRKKRRGR